MNMVRETVLIAVLTAPALAQPASPCKLDEIGVVVCPNGKSELRAIHGTLSSAKLYAVAWATEDGSTGSDYELMAHEDYKRVLPAVTGRLFSCASTTARCSYNSRAAPWRSGALQPPRRARDLVTGRKLDGRAL